MKKLTLLCTRASREVTLDALRELGAVHLQHVTSPEGEGLEQARRHFEYLQRALEVLPKHAGVSPSGKSAHEVVDEVWKLIHRKQELSEKIELLEIERRRYEPFGKFDVDDIQALREQGLQIRLMTAPIKRIPEPPDGASLIELDRDRTSASFVLISRDPVEIEAEELPLPECSADGMARHIEGLQKELAAVEEGFAEYIGDHDAVAAIAGEAEDHVVWLEARNGMGKEEEVCYLRGFFPAERENELRAAAEKQGWAVLVEDPAKNDPVPTLLRNPKWVSPVKAALALINVVPGYRELDVSAVFLIFLSIFFAFIIGDAGYGLLFIGLTLFGKFKTKGKKDAQPALNLMLIMSTATVVFGALTGNYFGIPIETLPAPLKALTNSYMTGWNGDLWDADLAANHIMFICFSIAVIHLSIAHLWNIVRKINSGQAFVDLGWLLCTWALYTVVLELVLDVNLFPFVKAANVPLLGAGVFSVAIGLLLTKSYIGLVTLFLDVISNFVDIISYIRLYAVGAASLAVAQAFNEMALGVGFDGLASLGAALILFAGHGLNIILGAMGVMVHGIRLNTLEFSGHAGVEWAGVHFNPFRKSKETFNKSNN
jgi:V/A-type H+/Na+-transporting ATPase subunit I